MRSLGDVDGDVDILLVGADRHLRRIDVEVDVALIQIERAQCFQIGRQLLARVSVVARVPGQPARGGELEQVQQIVFLEGTGTDDANLANARNVALIHLKGQCNPVAFERGDRRADVDAILGAGQILTLELLLGTLDQRAVEGSGLGDAHLGQPGEQRVLLEFLEADEFDFGDGRSLVDQHHQHAVVFFDLYVAEESGGEQVANRLRRLLTGEAVTHPHRQVAEYGARLRALDALHTNVAHDEGFECQRRASRQQTHDEAGK